jgi:hypothetical protein
MLYKEVSKLMQTIEVQCSDGNWNFDPYMHGMANGMIYSLSVITGDSPEFLTAPEVWLCDMPHDATIVSEPCPHDDITKFTRPFRG